MISAGIDAGSRAIKVVVFDHAEGRVLGRGLADQGLDQPHLAEALFTDTLRSCGLEPARVQAVVATGYGRRRVASATTTITEITCHARGVHHGAPETRSIVEIGGQDSKILWLEPDGQVLDFAMNDRCAAGTGRFLEILTARLGAQDLTRQDATTSSRQRLQPVTISSTCVVFAETEIISLLAEGVPAAAIAAGVLRSIATRVATMAGRALTPPIALTGGVALQPGMAQALEAALNQPVQTAVDPQFTGALGAALLAGARSRVAAP